jgi:hypothetical protein
MPRAGDTISLRYWLGAPYRSRQRIIREAEIREVHHVIIDANGVKLYDEIASAPDRDAFARADGFADWPEMRAWFSAEHGLPFSGIVIFWNNIDSGRAELKGETK